MNTFKFHNCNSIIKIYKFLKVKGPSRKIYRREKARDFWCILYMYSFMQINNVIADTLCVLWMLLSVDSLEDDRFQSRTTKLNVHENTCCARIRELFTALVLVGLNKRIDVTHPPRTNLPLLRFIWLAHRLIHATVITFFCFRRAPFFSTFLSVPPINASCSWLCMCSTLEKGELESSCDSGTTKVHGCKVYIKYAYRNILGSLQKFSCI